MSRAAIALACIVFCTALCFSQTPQETRLSLVDFKSERAKSAVDVAGSYQYLTGGPVSVVRLRVPAKVRNIFEKATKPFQKHKYAEARKMLNEALKRYPDFPEALTLLAYIQLDLQEWQSAEQNLQAALRVDPKYGLALLVLSDLYNRERRFDDALTMSQRATALVSDWSAKYETIRALMGKRQFAAALQESDAALRTNPGTLLHIAKAHALIGLKRYGEAAVELQTYLHCQPSGEGSADAHRLLNELQVVSRQ